MENAEIYPLLFEPQLRDYMWGGRNLERLFGRSLPPGPTAESWEISAHPDAPTEVVNGKWRGLALPALLDRLGVRLGGTRWPGRPCDDRFPLLVKLLDAQRDLSVQVHPDDAYACEHEESDPGKVECWYVLHADPGVQLVYGLTRDANREVIAKAAKEGSIPRYLRHLPVKAGDCVFVPAGTVHAVTAGVVLAEIQQNSDATYRLYDWGRAGDDGKPRELHVDRALDVIDWGGKGPGVVEPTLLSSSNGMRQLRMVTCSQFYLDKVELQDGAAYQGACTGETFEIWGCMDGAAELEWQDGTLTLERVRFVLLPADLSTFGLTAKGSTTLLRAYLGSGPVE